MPSNFTAKNGCANECKQQTTATIIIEIRRKGRKECHHPCVLMVVPYLQRLHHQDDVKHVEKRNIEIERDGKTDQREAVMAVYDD